MPEPGEVWVYVTDHGELDPMALSPEESRIVMRELLRSAKPGPDYRRREYRADAVLDRAMQEIGKRRFDA